MNLATYDWSYIHFLAQYNSSPGSSGNGLPVLLIYFAIYLFTSFCFYRIYQKLGEANAWFAWIPILQNWIMLKAGDQSPWWVIGLFIPIVNFVALIFILIAFFNIIKKLGKNPWLILLMIIPIVNFAMMAYFAFG